jgi:hypothetical protein
LQCSKCFKVPSLAFSGILLTHDDVDDANNRLYGTSSEGHLSLPQQQALTQQMLQWW